MTAAAPEAQLPSPSRAPAPAPDTGISPAAASNAFPEPPPALPPWPLSAQSLVVLSHGLDGCPGELGALASFLRESESESDPSAGAGADIFSPECNLGRTHDGALAGGARLAEAVRVRVEAAGPGRFRDISFVGMSLGGIYCRVAAGLLFDPETRTILGLQPRQLLTVATPHLGVGCWGPLGAVPRPFVHPYARLFLGETERELLLLDGGGEEGGGGGASIRGGAQQPPLEATVALPGGGEKLRLSRPLLLALSRPDSRFHAALAAFRSRVAYANCCNDLLVPFQSAAILPDTDPPPVAPSQFFGAPSVVRDCSGAWRGGGGDGDGDAAPADSAGQSSSAGRQGRQCHHPALPLARALVAPLASLSWRRVAVAVPGLLPAAHCAVTAHRGSALQALLFRHGEPLVRHQAQAVLAAAAAVTAVAAAAAGAAKKAVAEEACEDDVRKAAGTS